MPQNAERSAEFGVKLLGLVILSCALGSGGAWAYGNREQFGEWVRTWRGSSDSGSGSSGESSRGGWLAHILTNPEYTHQRHIDFSASSPAVQGGVHFDPNWVKTPPIKVEIPRIQPTIVRPWIPGSH